jgi:RNA polymerase sigma-70 factor (ECF subfamily)
MGCSDEELVRRWQSGDEAAFEDLVRRWEQPIGRLLSRLISPPELAQDLCQEVFLRVYQAGWRFRGDSSFSTWLYRIAVNVARDAARRRRPEPMPAGLPEPVDASNGAEQLCCQKELAAAVTQALARLPEPLREVLVLRHYQGLNYESMARVTGTPASTLKSRFAAALSRLRIHLQSFEDHEAQP